MSAFSNHRGRPKKKDGATDTLPPIRVTPKQKMEYKLAADQAGLTMSAWLKNLADSNCGKYK